MRRMLRVGLSGGIGSGKSTVAARFREHGALVIDADRLAREVVEPGTPGLAAVVAAFGGDVLTAEGALDRPALGKIIFSDEQKRLQLNGILHPLIGQRTGELMQDAGPGSIVVHDVPLLVEGGLAGAYHLVVIVWAPAAMRVQRLADDRGMTLDDAWARVRAQASDEDRRAVADVWIDNSGTREATIAQVDECWEDRIVRLAGQTSD
jgi:dephospho-CoA kinase